MRVTGRLFKPSMVRALLEDRKKQTRRIITPQPDEDGLAKVIDGPWTDTNGKEYPSPWGGPGDLVYVREQFSLPNNHCRYYADDPRFPVTWKPSIHLPRKHSRLTLRIIDIRVERLQQINMDDALSEGLQVISKDGGQVWKYGIPDIDGLPGEDNFGWHWQKWHVDPRMAYRQLWDDINGGGAWLMNPFVWCISFEVIKQNVDAYLKMLEAA